MIALTGLVRTLPSESLWGRFHPSIDLGPFQGIFFLREGDYALQRVELSGAEAKTLRSEPTCHALILCRDFGVRLSASCQFEGPWAGVVETEVRLRWLDNAAEWPRWIGRGRSEAEIHEAATPERHLARLVGGLFEAELIRYFGTQPYWDVSRRLNDPALVEQVEAQVRNALSRWTDERVIGVAAVHLLRIHSPAAEQQRQSDDAAAQEKGRLEREHRLRMLEAQQAAELASLRAKAAPSPPAGPEAALPPRIPSTEEKQDLVRRVLGELAGAQPEAVRVRLFAWGGKPAKSVNELAAAAPGGASALRVGDDIHVIVDAPVSGYLWVFNLGSSGEVDRIVPERLEPAAAVKAGQSYLVSTGAAIAPVSSEPPPASPWMEQGPANGFPERILAIVTAENTPLAPSSLHPAWSGSGPAPTRPAAGFGAPRIEATLGARPTRSWAWGVAEAAVLP
jgi:hypothetical protein